MAGGVHTRRPAQRWGSAGWRLRRRRRVGRPPARLWRRLRRPAAQLLRHAGPASARHAVRHFPLVCWSHHLEKLWRSAATLVCRCCNIASDCNSTQHATSQRCRPAPRQQCAHAPVESAGGCAVESRASPRCCSRPACHASPPCRFSTHCRAHTFSRRVAHPSCRSFTFLWRLRICTRRSRPARWPDATSWRRLTL